MHGAISACFRRAGSEAIIRLQCGDSTVDVRLSSYRHCRQVSTTAAVALLSPGGSVNWPDLRVTTPQPPPRRALRSLSCESATVSSVVRSRYLKAGRAPQLSLFPAGWRLDCPQQVRIVMNNTPHDSKQIYVNAFDDTRILRI